IKRIPYYSRVGWITAWIFVIVILAIALKIFLGTVDYNRNTEAAEIQHYLELGLENGRQGEHVELPEAVMENPFLRNAYNKGFREGWDDARAESKQ
ncbi:MAG: hypothetical protein VST72_00025, partial [Nitrospirota bacterium]|nr:hypothetical protein [Nitrospirota bacterium]